MGYTATQDLVDSSDTWALFKSWASGICAQILAMGWAQTADTGQVDWSTVAPSIVNITDVLDTSGVVTYTYTLTSGPALRKPYFMRITGLTNPGNNGMFDGIFDFPSPTTFRIFHSGAVNATLQTGTGESGVPSSGTYPYDQIWKPTDALQAGASQFFLKIEFGNRNIGEPTPSVRVSIGTGTDGAGTFLNDGLSTDTVLLPKSGDTFNLGGSRTFQCNFSGDTNRLGMILWRNEPTQDRSVAFAIERLKDTAGVDTADGVTLAVFSESINLFANVVSLVFGSRRGVFSATGAFLVQRDPTASWLFNNSIPISHLFPTLGTGYSNPHTVVAITSRADVVEGMLLTTSLYGATRTYLVSESKGLGLMGPTGDMSFLLRYD